MASVPHLLIDADIILYQTTAVCEQEADWSDGFATRWTDMRDVENTILDTLHHLFEKFDTESYTMCLSDYHDPFRKRLADYYKESRDGSKKPLGYAQAVKLVEQKHPYERYPSLEADDVLGILATSGRYDRPIIVSDDKDLKQIPGELYVPRLREHFRITPESGFRFHMHQTLTGDRADNYPGCPGIGEVRAERILDQPANGDLWYAVEQTFAKARLPREEALLQARLAKILTTEWWNTETQEPILWTPSSKTPSVTVSSADITSHPHVAATIVSKPAATSTTAMPREKLKAKTTLRSR